MVMQDKTESGSSPPTGQDSVGGNLTSNPQCKNDAHQRMYADGTPDESCVYCQIERLTRRAADLQHITDQQADEIERLTAELALERENTRTLIERQKAERAALGQVLRAWATGTNLPTELVDEHWSLTKLSGSAKETMATRWEPLAGAAVETTEPLNCPICHQWPGHHFDWCTKAGDDKC